MLAPTSKSNSANTSSNISVDASSTLLVHLTASNDYLSYSYLTVLLTTVLVKLLYYYF